jgi:hypothetical protein
MAVAEGARPPCRRGLSPTRRRYHGNPGIEGPQVDFVGWKIIEKTSLEGPKKKPVVGWKCGKKNMWQNQQASSSSIS